MKRLSIASVVLFALGCLAIGIFINFVVLGNVFDLQGAAYAVVSALSIAVSGLVIYLLTFLLIKENKRGFSAEDFGRFDSDAHNAKNLIDEIGGHMTEIRLLNDYIADSFVSDELSEIEKSIYKLQKQLKDETIGDKRIAQLKEFFEYYMPLIVKILNSYRRIETNQLTGGNAVETKTQISAILPLIKKAFEKELDYMLTDEMLDITTDIKVLESMLSKDGLLDKNNII